MNLKYIFPFLFSQDKKEDKLSDLTKIEHTKISNNVTLLSKDLLIIS